MAKTALWVSFTDDGKTTWLFDLSFLLSGWECTFGTTCQGTEPGDNGARGCCAHGAHLTSDAERERISRLSRRLTPRQWENHGLVETDGDLFEIVDGDQVTARYDDACVFLNSVDFGGGHGCALHIAALEAGERPIDWKPDVCWQVPFRVEYYEDASGTETVAVRAWRRTDWGEGGADFGWWCTEDVAPAASLDATTFARHRDELVELVGEWATGQLENWLRNDPDETPVRFRGQLGNRDAGSSSEAALGSVN